ncbi:berberine bridge enzyme-like 15 [Coffea eugenioides]|uniref:berberine bridge enzyme-like 15 n=1 Tax=Coffea eugenioides TaxID=49369 RepID=UPI000F6104CE|nr:berberine bridge enzyme-like 15 [Coffea eugenioides]
MEYPVIIFRTVAIPENRIAIVRSQDSRLNSSSIHGFLAGLYLGLGIGGHFSGGGVGNLIRKYGLAADNVIDACIIDANGQILDSRSMGADLFWAIRGAGGACFGVKVAWKIKLVHVPPVVSVFTISKALEQAAIDVIHKWQYLGHKLSEDLLLSIVTTSGNDGTIQATFNSLFLGKADHLLNMIDDSFPEIH